MQQCSISVWDLTIFRWQSAYYLWLKCKHQALQSVLWVGSGLCLTESMQVPATPKPPAGKILPISYAQYLSWRLCR